MGGMPWPCCYGDLSVWLGAGAALAYGGSLETGTGVCVQCGHLGHSCNSWGLQEEVHLQIIIDLPLEVLFDFLSVAMTFICSTPFEVNLSCSLFTLIL